MDSATRAASSAGPRPPPLAAEAIADSRFPGPFPVGSYAARLRRRLQEFARVQLVGEVWGFRESRVRVYFELRDAHGALPCSMWRDDFERLDVTLADGMRVVVGGGCDYYPGSGTSSPAFSFAVTELRPRRRGRPAGRAGTAAPASARRGTVRAPEAAAAGRAAADHRSRHRREREGARRRPGRPAPAGLERAAGLGLRPRPGPPRGAPDRGGAARTGGHAGGGGGDRRPRRGLAGRSLRLLRRGAVPDRGAVARAGDLVGRPPHGPHAHRRRRRRVLLDAHPRRRGGGSRRLRRRPPGAGRRRRAAARPWPTARSSCGRGRWPSSRGLRRSTSRATAGACTSCCASCAPPRAAKPTAAACG